MEHYTIIYQTTDGETVVKDTYSAAERRLLQGTFNRRGISYTLQVWHGDTLYTEQRISY